MLQDLLEYDVITCQPAMTSVICYFYMEQQTPGIPLPYCITRKSLITKERVRAGGFGVHNSWLPLRSVVSQSATKGEARGCASSEAAAFVSPALYQWRHLQCLAVTRLALSKQPFHKALSVQPCHRPTARTIAALEPPAGSAMRCELGGRLAVNSAPLASRATKARKQDLRGNPPESSGSVRC